MNHDALVTHPTRRFILKIGSLAAGSLLLQAPGWAQTNPAVTKIGVIGSGKIGSTVGTLWVKAGHQVLFSSRHPEELKELVAGLGSSARAGTPEEAIAFGDAILLAVPYKAYPQVGKDYAKALAGKVVLDAGNATVARDGQELVDETKQNGLGKTTAKYFPGARIVRAFNTLGYTVLARNAHKDGGLQAIPIAGDDKDALGVASKLVRDAGFEPVVVGGLAMGKYLNVRTPLAGIHTPDEIRQIVATLK